MLLAHVVTLIVYSFASIHLHHCRLLLQQESCAIAKTTMRCALYVDALKILASLTVPTDTFPKIFNGLLSDGSCECACKI